MSVCSHGSHQGPGLLLRVVTLGRVQRLQPVTTSDDEEFVIDDGDAKLETSAIHLLYLYPLVRSEVVTLYGRGT